MHLHVQDLTISDGRGQALLDRVSFSLAAGERAALVGASGAGKSMLALALLRLLRPPLHTTAGQAWLDGEDLLALDPRALRGVRGTGVFLVFQSAGSLFDPVTRIGRQLEQTAGRAGIERNLRHACMEVMAQVGLPAECVRQYPFELSGGMKQRLLIAMALLLRPKLLIADEPTSGLDDDTAREVLAVLDAALRVTGSSLLFITHDLRLVQRHCGRVLVVDAGRLVEDAPVEQFMIAPASGAGRALCAAAQFLRGWP